MVSQVGGEAEWLTLEQACKRLGVHPSTLRRWADHGAIGVFVTPGGHRRFSRADIERFERERHRIQRSPALTGLIGAGDLSEQPWAERAITRARESMHAQAWVGAYGEDEREAKRRMGRRLIGLVLQYVSRADEADDLLAEARAIGEQHGLAGLDHGTPLADLLQVISFFRTTLLEVTVLQLPESALAQPEAGARLLHRIERLLGEVQRGVAESYTARRQP